MQIASIYNVWEPKNGDEKDYKPIESAYYHEDAARYFAERDIDSICEGKTEWNLKVRKIGDPDTKIHEIKVIMEVEPVFYVKTIKGPEEETT